MASTARTAARLSDVLSRSNNLDNKVFERILADTGDATMLLEAIIEEIRPVDGTFDAEAARRSLWDALSELLTTFPEADLGNLSDHQRWYAVERFVAFEVFNLFCRDMLKTLSARAPDHTTGLRRLAQVQSFINQVVAASFQRLHEADSSPQSRSVGRVVAEALADTFAVFESYL